MVVQWILGRDGQLLSASVGVLKVIHYDPDLAAKCPKLARRGPLPSLLLVPGRNLECAPTIGAFRGCFCAFV